MERLATIKVLIPPGFHTEGHNRIIDVMIDGVKVETLSWGDEQSFNVAPGSHRIQLHRQLFRTPEIRLDLKDGEAKSLKMVCNPYVSFIAFLVLLAEMSAYTFGPIVLQTPLTLLVFTTVAVCFLPGINCTLKAAH